MKLKAVRHVLPINFEGNDYVVGDIHGHVTKLQRQLDDLGFDYDKDRLICVGDLIDRGSESAEALDLLKQPWFFSVIGNHEYLMLSGMKYQHSKDRMTWLKHGGEWIMQTDASMWPEWFDLIEQLPIAIEVESTEGVRYGIVHADYPSPNWNSFERFNAEELYRCIWSRGNFQCRSPHSVKGIDIIFHGHSVSDGELQLGNRIYIEQGAFLGNNFIIKRL